MSDEQSGLYAPRDDNLDAGPVSITVANVFFREVVDGRAAYFADVVVRLGDWIVTQWEIMAVVDLEKHVTEEAQRQAVISAGRKSVEGKLSALLRLATAAQGGD